MARGDELAAETPGPLGETGGLSEYSTVKAQSVSKTVAHMRPVGATEAYSWVKYWHVKGLF